MIECFGCGCTNHECAPDADGACYDWHFSCADAVSRREGLMLASLRLQKALRRWRPGPECTHTPIARCWTCVVATESSPRRHRVAEGGGGNT